MSDKKKYLFYMVIVVVIGILFYFKGLSNVESETSATGFSQLNVNGLQGQQESTIFVQVSGEVINDGVYELPLGSRVFEAVELAGGTTTRAALYMVNQAEILEDGAHIHFQALVEPSDGESDLININTANVDELVSLPGIGEAKANSIIAYREENGYFDDIEDIMEISGIKEALFSQIKDFVTIY